MDVKFEMKGLAGLNKELKRLPEDFRTKALNGATAASTRHLRDIAIRNAPSDTGNLKTAIKSGKAPKKEQFSKWTAIHKVTLKKGRVTILTRGKKRRSTSGYYGRFVEEGTKKMPARPFMRPAFMQGRAESVRIFTKILDKKIAFYQRKIARLRK